MRDIFNIYKITEDEVLLDLNGQEIGEEELITQMDLKDQMQQMQRLMTQYLKK